MNATERLVTRAIAEQARAWLIANREPSLSTEHQIEFLTWLRASPVHVREYLAAAKAAVELRAAADAVDTPTQELIAQARSELDDNVASIVPLHPGDEESTTAQWERQPARNLRSPRLMALAASFCALAVAALTWWNISHLPTNKEYRTVHGEQRVVRFEDGSIVHINSDSIVLVDFTKGERHVSMERGQAMFKVAKDKTRPFRVSVGSTDVVAVGTEFDVRRLSEDVLVTVVEGAVAVSSAGKFDSAASAKPSMPLKLAAGQQARVAQAPVTKSPRPATRQPVDVRSVDIRPAVAWVEQKIMFERQTLQSVVSEFNRYGPTQFVIEDSEAAALTISGIFNAYDLESFVLYLQTINGLQVHQEPNLIRISLARNTDGETM
jgi:transmembrane sensor